MYFLIIMCLYNSIYIYFFLKKLGIWEEIIFYHGGSYVSQKIVFNSIFGLYALDIVSVFQVMTIKSIFRNCPIFSKSHNYFQLGTIVLDEVIGNNNNILATLDCLQLSIKIKRQTHKKKAQFISRNERQESGSTAGDSTASKGELSLGLRE